MLSLLRRLFARQPKKKPIRRPSTRLGLESLEAREVPAQVLSFNDDGSFGITGDQYVNKIYVSNIQKKVGLDLVDHYRIKSTSAISIINGINPKTSLPQLARSSRNLRAQIALGGGCAS